MKRAQASSLNPRKMPSQARSAVTVEVILEAAIHILLTNGFEKMSTTRIAERAGVSVGSLYQYFPNKRALLAALVRRHVARVADRVEQACASAHGATLQKMCAKAINASIDAKTERVDISRALYLPAAMAGGAAIVSTESERVRKAFKAMLETASDISVKQPDAASAVVVSAVVGPVQMALESGAAAAQMSHLRVHLTDLCVGYLREINRH